MLIRWLFWIFLAWYIYRTVGKLFGLTFGKEKNLDRVEEGAEPMQTVTRPRQPEVVQHDAPIKKNIEDATFKDLD